MATSHYRLKIVRGDRELEAEGDKGFVLQMLKRFDSSASSSGPPGLPAKALSVAEFIRGLRLKKHTDISLAFGYYLQQYLGLQEFTAADIRYCYYEAKMEAPNPSLAILVNIKRGWMMHSKSKDNGATKRYILTEMGEEFIKRKLEVDLQESEGDHNNLGSV